jgi:hypothetical protein
VVNLWSVLKIDQSLISAAWIIGNRVDETMANWGRYIECHRPKARPTSAARGCNATCTNAGPQSEHLSQKAQWRNLLVDASRHSGLLSLFWLGDLCRNDDIPPFHDVSLDCRRNHLRWAELSINSLDREGVLNFPAVDCCVQGLI